MSKVLEAFHEGRAINAYTYFGAHKKKRRGKSGYRFALYAPNAKEVQLIGDFNDWDGTAHCMTKVDDKGVWEIYAEDVDQWDLYKFNIKDQSDNWIQKSDPYAFYSELRPKTSSVVVDMSSYKWNDTPWMRGRNKNLNRPLNIYECHLGSWRRDHEKGEWLSSDEWISQLVPYVKDNGYTHVEFMPLNEHPFDGSWGYQATGYYSATSRYGTPNDLKKLIDAFHQEGIGVILDIVPAHFVKDAHGLANFDGSPVYEYPKQDDAENQWGTLNFNLWDDRVRSFLISSFAFWIKEYHFDGLRFDAIAHVIHWGGDKNRGPNQGAIDFFKRTNYLLAKNFKSAMLIAEDSSDYQGVTSPTFEGGLGFDYKWDLGWMNDTLKYFKQDPIDRKFHHNLVTFSMLYFYSERFLLPLSHDEVVHMKGSIINKMWGTYEQKFAQMRLLMAYMFAHPGKKLNFMGNEIASFEEWSEKNAVGFHLLKYPVHDAFLRYFKDLSFIYKSHPSFYKLDYDYRGYTWIDADNKNQSIFSFYRTDGVEIVVCVLNMTPVSYEDFRIGVPKAGYYSEILNSEKDIYNGCNMCNFKPLSSQEQFSHGMENSISLRVAPFSAIYFLYEGETLQSQKPKKRRRRS